MPILATIKFAERPITSHFETRELSNSRVYILVHEKEVDGTRIESRLYLDLKKIQGYSGPGVGRHYPEQLLSSEIVDEPAE